MKTPHVPLGPNELPRQHLYEVVDIPKQPAVRLIELLDYEHSHSFDGIPQKPTQKSVNLCQVEWAWSPMHNRLDAYCLHQGRTHWLLWMGHHNDQEWMDWHWEWYPAAAMPVKQASFKQAAVYLLMEQWHRETECRMVDRFHWINEEGALSVPEIQAIANIVWPVENKSEPKED